MLKQSYRRLVVFFAIALLLACAPVAVATPPAAPPTVDILLLNTTIAQTAGAAATQTFVLLPTLTPSPTVTKTPTEVPSSTPTFLFVIPTSTVPSSTPTLDPSSGPYACRVVSQTPGDGTAFPRKALFEMHWLVLNIGTATWDVNSADYRYAGGDQLHKASAYDFTQSVAPGSSMDFVVAMQAPDEPGSYATNWQIALGKERFCRMNIKIVVNQ
jgi:hypothetical protein